MKKRAFKKILSAALAVLLIGGVIFGAAKIFGNDTKSIGSTAFSVGAIGADGEYAENDQTLYIKKMFECKGLTVELDYESNTEYVIYWYNLDGNLLNSTEKLDKSFNGEVPAAAKYARIMLIPAVPEGETKSSFSINFFEKYGFANDVKIRVSRDQNMENLLEEGQINIIAQPDPSTNNKNLVYQEAEGKIVSEPIKLAKYSELYVKNNDKTKFMVYVVDSENVILGSYEVKGEDFKTIKSSDYVGGYLVITYSVDDAEPAVYPYK